MKKWKRITALFLCLSLVLPLIGCQNKDGVAAGVKSAQEAVAQLAELGEVYGYENALSELTEKNTSTIDGDTYYRLQQNYQGIPVYGRTVVYIVDNCGSSIAITGNALDVNGLLSLSPSISQSEAEASIETYFTNILRYDSDLMLKMKEFDESCLYIYNLGLEGISHLAYRLSAMAGDSNYFSIYEIIIDANTGEVLLCNDLLQSENEAEGTLQGQQTIYRAY